MTNYKKAKILIRIIQILLVILFFIYLNIRFINVIDSQLQKTLNIMYTSIKDIIPTKGPYVRSVVEYVKEQTSNLTGLVIKGEIDLAFLLLTNIYKNIYTILLYKDPYEKAELKIKRVFKLLQYSVPYLNVSFKFFYYSAMIHYYIPFYNKPKIILYSILLLIVILLLLKIYTIAKEDVNGNKIT